VSTPIQCDICVIGAGSGGLSVAAGAVQMGARAVLIERGKMGGDCLNYGCVPSKALIAAAHAAQAQRSASHFGIADVEPSVDMARVRDHIRAVIAAIEPHDSVERFEGLGVTVIKGTGSFVGPTEIAVGDQRVRAKRVVVATGSRPMAPPIPSLDTVPYFTNETIFDVAEPIRHLVVIGGGPIGVELAQAHRRLGAQVTVVEMANVLGRDDPECTAIVKQHLVAEGVELRERTGVVEVDRNGDKVDVIIEKDGVRDSISASHLLVAAGRQPVMDHLNLESGGIEYTPKGISVDHRLRTSNPKVFAIGDVAGGYQFTHVAGYHAGIVIRNALFRLPAKVDNRAVPWVTYTDPELAHVGMTQAEANEAGIGDAKILRWPLADNDRAQAERKTDGLIKVLTDRRGRALGATIVGPAAGELILPWVLMVQKREKVGTMASVIAPYPTLGEISKRAAGSYFTPALFSERTRTIVRFLLRFA